MLSVVLTVTDWSVGHRHRGTAQRNGQAMEGLKLNKYEKTEESKRVLEPRRTRKFCVQSSAG